MTALVVALLAPALAVERSSAAWGVTLGVETMTNHPVEHRHGLRLGAGWSPVEWVEVGVSASWYPILGKGGEHDPDWKPLLDGLRDEHTYYWDPPQLVGQGQLVVRVLPVRIPLGGGWDAGAGGLAGVGAFAERQEGTALPLRPGAVWGVFWQVNTPRTTVRVRYDQGGYAGRFQDDFYLQLPAFLGLEVTCWL